MDGKRMTDRENAIRRINALLDEAYNDDFKVLPVFDMLGALNDAREMLKAQEPIRPNVTKRKTGFGNVLSCWFDCGNCNKPIERLKYKFCPYCGKGIKWDESEKDD